MEIKNIPKSNPNIVFREEGNEALLFNPVTGRVKVLNETGKIIWNNLDGKNSKEVLIQKISDSFDGVDEQKAREDLDKFLADLETLNFLIKM